MSRASQLYSDIFNLSTAVFFGAAFVGWAGATYSHVIEPSWVETTHLSLHLPRLGEGFQGYRLVQISDIHMDGWMNRSRLDDIVDRVNSLKPDLVVITGDFVTHEPWKYEDDLVTSLGRLSARDGVLSVLGNHDHWAGVWTVQKILKKSNIQNLNNQVITLQCDGSRLHIGGIDDYYTGYARLDKVIEQLPQDGAAILLAHEPDFADISAATGRFDLQLSGHSHGGQVVLPFIGAPYLPRYCRKYPSGLYKVGNMFQYTNRGLGSVHFKIRFNSRPEITSFTFN
ncbi:MAG: metallophosphoesterase [Omnitrophica WOR_2 bacterium]